MTENKRKRRNKDLVLDDILRKGRFLGAVVFSLHGPRRHSVVERWQMGSGVSNVTGLTNSNELLLVKGMYYWDYNI